MSHAFKLIGLAALVVVTLTVGVVAVAASEPFDASQASPFGEVANTEQVLANR